MYPNPNVSWMFCGKCGRPVSRPDEQDSGLCRKCKSAGKGDPYGVIMNIDAERSSVVLKPMRTETLRKGDIVLFSHRGVRYLFWVKEPSKNFKWAWGYARDEKPANYWRRCNYTSLDDMNEVIAIVGHKVVTLKEVDKLLDWYAAIPHIFELEVKS